MTDNDDVRVEREATIPIPFARFTRKDLDDIADRFSGLAQARERQARADADAYIVRLGNDIDVAAREDVRNLHLRHAESARFAVTTKFASFSGRSWSSLWVRVNALDVSSIEMRWSDSTTELDVSLDLATRRTSAYTNRIHLKSADSDVYDRETGFFRRLLDGRRAVWAERLTTGIVGIALWFVAPAFTIGLAVQLLLLRVRGAEALSNLVNDLVWGGVFGGFVLLFGSEVMLRLLTSVAPRVAIEDAGPARSSATLAYQIAVGLLVTLVGTVLLAIWSDLTRVR